MFTQSIKFYIFYLRILKSTDHQITRNRTLASLQQLYSKMCVDFQRNTEICFITEISITSGKNAISSAKLY